MIKSSNFDPFLPLTFPKPGALFFSSVTCICGILVMFEFKTNLKSTCPTIQALGRTNSNTCSSQLLLSNKGENDRVKSFFSCNHLITNITFRTLMCNLQQNQMLLSGIMGEDKQFYWEKLNLGQWRILPQESIPALGTVYSKKPLFL